MFHERKFTIVLEVLILVQILLIQSVFFVNASIRSGKAKSSVYNPETVKEPSSNQISVEAKENAKSEEQFYYLPMPTVFSETGTLTKVGGLFTTSPPHLSINPAPIQTDFQENTNIFHEDSSAGTSYYSGVYQSQCVSETPVIQLESRFLLPSRDLVKESVIMSGHLEIASKTSSDEEFSEINNIVSKPSIELQGTVLHSHTVTDL